MKLLNALFLASVLTVGLSLANSHSEQVDYQTDVLLRKIPDASLTSFENPENEITYLRKVVDKLRNEVVDRNDEIYNLRSSLRNSEEQLEKLQNPTGNKYQLSTN